MDFEFEHYELRVVATCQYDVREDGTYLGDIDFDVFDVMGEDVTYDISGVLSMDIHQRIIELAQQARELTKGCSRGI